MVGWTDVLALNVNQACTPEIWCFTKICQPRVSSQLVTTTQLHHNEWEKYGVYLASEEKIARIVRQMRLVGWEHSMEGAASVITGGSALHHCLRMRSGLGTTLMISELNSAIAFFRLKNAIALCIQLRNGQGGSKTTSRPKTMTCKEGETSLFNQLRK